MTNRLTGFFEKDFYKQIIIFTNKFTYLCSR